MAISARGLVARRNRFRLELDVFHADAGGAALLGRNGAGKSTLLLALQGLVACNGRVERPRRCAGVFAQPAMLRGSVMRNVVAIVRATIGLDERAARQRARDVLARAGLGDLENLDAARLSSGQRQRLALARAIALEPQALFLDEPFAHVDADGRPAMRNLVRDYLARSGCTLVLATQNLADVTALCKAALILDGGSVLAVLETTQIAASRIPYLQALVAESRGLP